MRNILFINQVCEAKKKHTKVCNENLCNCVSVCVCQRGYPGRRVCVCV